MSTQAQATGANPNAAILPKPGVRDASAGGYAVESIFELGPDNSVLVHSFVRWCPSYPEYPDEVLAMVESLSGEIILTPDTAHAAPADLLVALVDYRPLFAAVAPALMAQAASVARTINAGARVSFYAEFHYQSLYGAIKPAGQMVVLEMDLPDGQDVFGRESLSEGLEVSCYPQGTGELAFRVLALNEAMTDHQAAWRDLFEARAEEFREILAFVPPTEWLARA